MNRLFLLRHAKAVPQAGGGEDHERALAPRGERAISAIGTWMAAHRLVPELVLCSSAVRTRQTVALLLPALGGRPEPLYEDGLYLAGARALLARLRELPASRRSVLVVGHNPGLHELASLLAENTAGPLAKHLKDGLPTAGLAGFELAGGWDELRRGGARLVHFVTPKGLAADD